MGAEMPNNASAQKAGSAEYDDGTLLHLGAIARCHNRLLPHTIEGRSCPLAAEYAHRSISPNTMSSDPMIAETSASMCPRLKKSIACRWANDGARILHLYGRFVPSATR